MRSSSASEVEQFISWIRGNVMPVANITETRTYLTFTLDDEVFAVDVGNVREVLDYTSVTKVPKTPDYMKGVINLRGNVVPVVDMRLKFGLPAAELSVDTCIIVMEVNMDDEATVIGAMADSVKEVFELDPENIEPLQSIGTRFDTQFISGMGKHNDDFIIILDINKVFTSEEFILIGETSRLSSSEDEVTGSGKKSSRKVKKAAAVEPLEKDESGEEMDTVSGVT